MNSTTSQQQLRIIEQMMASTRAQMAENSVYFLIWGYAIFLASVLHYILLFTDFSYHFIGWPIITIITLVVYGVVVYKKGKNEEVQSLPGRVAKYLWLACLAGILLLVAFGAQIGYHNLQALIIMLYAIGVITSSALYRFKPLLYGGLFAFACAFFLFLVPMHEQLLLCAASILGSYIIPGHLLRKKVQPNGHLSAT